MKFIITLVLLLSTPFVALARDGTLQGSFLELSAKNLEGKEVPFSKYKGKVLLVTNIALKCGTTPQLHALQSLYEEFSSEGLIVMGFPSNDFTGEDVSKNKSIHDTCSQKFGVTFPLFTPGVVTGPKKQPVYSFLCDYQDSNIQGEVEFNFEKFLVDRSGRVRKRYGPFTGAQSHVLRNDLEMLLAEKLEG